jgi:hypothetical protein
VPDRLAIVKRARVSLRSVCLVVYYVSSFLAALAVPCYLHLARKRRDIGIDVRRSWCKACYVCTADK